MLDLFQSIQKALYEKGVYSNVDINHIDNNFYLTVLFFDDDFFDTEIICSSLVTHEELTAWLEEIRR